MPTRIGITCNEQLIRGKFGCPIKIYRATCFVGRKRNHAFNSSIYTSIYEVHGTIDICFDTFKWIVFCSGNNLGCRSMHHIIHTIQRAV